MDGKGRGRHSAAWTSRLQVTDVKVDLRRPRVLSYTSFFRVVGPMLRPTPSFRSPKKKSTKATGLDLYFSIFLGRSFDCLCTPCPLSLHTPA